MEELHGKTGVMSSEAKRVLAILWKNHGTG